MFNKKTRRKSIPVSVLMSLYHNSKSSDVYQSISSTFNLQLYIPRQFVVVVDGPISDATNEILHCFYKHFPNFFTIVQLPNNLGLGHALNFGLLYCKYPLVARMDADDISLPNRLFLQYKFMMKHPTISVVGGQITGWDQKLSRVLLRKHLPLTQKSIVKFAKYRCPLNHPSVMFRKDHVLASGGYPSNIFPEDYPLWCNMLIKGYKFSNLPCCLVNMRISDAINNRRGFKILLPEVKMYLYIYSIGFINIFQLFINIILRAMLRLCPSSIRLLIYKALS